MAKSGLIGLDKHLRRMRAIGGPAMTKAVGAALFNAGERIQVEAQISISEGSVSGKGHVPSAPGEPPNQDTGVLAAMITTTQTGLLEVEVSSNAPYAAPLEFGSKRDAGVGARSFAGNVTAYGPSRAKHGPVKMEWGDSETPARPYMTPARNKKVKEVEEIVTAAARAVVKRAGK